MNGQIISYKEKMNIAENYISRIKPYEKPEPLNFDLRGYSDYLEKNGLTGQNISKTITEKFKK